MHLLYIFAYFAIVLFSAGLRGVTANVIIMEEAAFIEPALFNEVIVPLLGVEGTAVLAITTPEQDLDNYFTILMDLKDPETDEDLFKTIRLGLACEACVAAGKGAECTHMAHLAPP